MNKYICIDKQTLTVVGFFESVAKALEVAQSLEAKNPAVYELASLTDHAEKYDFDPLMGDD